MVIQTSVKVKRPTSPKPTTSPYAPAFEIIKAATEWSGYYDDYFQYLDPDWYYDKYVKKYTYAPRKRVAGYVGQKIHSKKKFRSASGNQFYKECTERLSWNNWYPGEFYHC